MLIYCKTNLQNWLNIYFIVKELAFAIKSNIEYGVLYVLETFPMELITLLLCSESVLSPELCVMQGKLILENNYSV